MEETEIFLDGEFLNYGPPLLLEINLQIFDW